MNQEARGEGHRAGRYIPGIDGLRAIAVLSVILFHLDASLLPGGFVGVDVFFVISGYVISRSLAHSETGCFRDFVLDFYKRRVLRIFPALVVCLGVTSLLAAMFIPSNFWLSEHNNLTGLWAFFGVSNFYLVSGADGYFSARIPFNPYVHTWSLAVEEQFYVFFPLIFYAWLRLRINGNRYQRLALAVLPTIALLSLGFAMIETQVAHERAFYLLPSRFWELAAGAMLYQFHVYRPAYFQRAVRWMLPGGVLLLALGFVFTDEAQFPFPWALIPVAGALLLIAGAITKQSGDSWIGRALASRGMSYTGRISYSLYLWHWPVFVLFRWTYGLSGPIHGLLALALTFALAVLSYRYIETGLRGSRLLAGQASWKIVGGGALAICGAYYGVSMLFNFAQPLGLALSVTNNDCLWRPDNAKCQQEAKAEQVNRRLFVMGDSHAGAYHLMAQAAANRNGAEVYFFSRSGCPIAQLIAETGDTSRCKQFERNMLDWLDRRAKPGDIVFLASLRLQRLGNQWGMFNLDEVSAQTHSEKQMAVNGQALIQAKALIGKLQDRGLHVLLDAPKPIFQAPPFRCADWFNKNNPVCAAGFAMDRDFLLSHREPTMVSLRALQAEQGVYLWDPFPILCTAATCSAFDGDKPLFFDGDHLSGHGNRLLIDSFSGQLAAIWKPDAQSRQDRFAVRSLATH